MQRRSIRFSGHVQGVGFRATASGMASGRPLTGWVRNEPDGSVLMEVQGDPPDVDAYLAALRGRLEGLIASEKSETIPLDPSEARFQIRR